MTMDPPPRRLGAAWAHPPAPAMSSARARAIFEGTPSRRTARTAPCVLRAGIPRRRRSSARAGNESEETINALKGIRTRGGRVSCRKIQRVVADLGVWAGASRRDSRGLFDRIGRYRRTAALAGRLGDRAGHLRGRLGPFLQALAGGECRDILALHQGGHLLAVEDLVLQESLR